MKEVMKLALEALEDRGELSANEFKEKKNDAIIAIKEALAQPEQEIYKLICERDDARFALRKLREQIQGDCV